ncbi:MAG: Clp1/GlmU family protein [Vulcanisaeta sp.]
MEIQTIKSGEFLSIDGPANVRVIEGKIYVLGVEYGPGSSFTVMRGRRIITKALSDSKVELIVGPDGGFEKISGTDEVLDAWDKALSSISLNGSIIIVLGAMDVGKTTITTILANKGIKEGLKVGIIDGDPGQNDIGPPTTVSSAIAEKFITHLAQLRSLRTMFVKTTSIEHVWSYVLDSILKLIDDLRNNYRVNTVIINTDGWVSEPPAVSFKLEMVRRVRADYIIVIKREREVEDLISKLVDAYGNHVIILPAPPNAKIRDRDDRKIRREMGYSKYLMPSRDLSISIVEKPIVNLPLFRGIRYDKYMLSLIRKNIGPITYVEQWGNVAVAIGNVNEFQIRNLGNVSVAILPMNWEKGLLVALEDRDDYLLALGMLRKIYYNTGKAIVTVSKSFNEEGKIDHIRLGMIRLNENFEEVDKVLYINKIESMLSSQKIAIKS